VHGVRKFVATFSIVAFDPETDSLGVAVQSKFLAVGSVVPWARAGVGAVATQAMANYNFGPRGLEFMARGKTAVRREVADVLRRRGYVQEQDIEDDVLFDALSAYIRTENFEEREQQRGYLDRAVLEYMKEQS
jgi:uncharacterized Ntn-hydrolase superfamily protein